MIATPNHTHAAVLADVFRTQKHVLVEKPLCTTLEDCLRVEEAAARHPGVVWVGMEYRYMPPVARLIDEVRRGTIGRLRMLAIREHRFPFLPKVGDWNRFARNTGGTLVEKCCHFFDLMRLIVGARALRVYASGGQDVNHLDERYDGASAGHPRQRLRGGRLRGRRARAARPLHVRRGLAPPGGDRRDRRRGQARVLPAGIDAGDRPPRTRAASRRSRFPSMRGVLEAGFHHGATFFEHLAFQRAIREGRPPEVSVRDGLLAVALGLAAERSAAEHRPVELAELGL